MSEKQQEEVDEEIPEVSPPDDEGEVFLFDNDETIMGEARANYTIEIAQLAQEAARWERAARSEKKRRVLYEKLLTPAQRRKAGIDEPLPPARSGKGNKPRSKKKK